MGQGEQYVSSHVKASSAGSTQRQATGLGRSFRGAFATRGVSSGAGGSGARSGRAVRGAAGLLASLLALMVAASSALAAAPIVEGQSSSNVADTSAILKALINPNGEPTGYLFEYVTAAQFSGSGFAEATSVPPSGEAIGDGTAGVPVSQQIDNLLPDTT
jgi:hypothetical protein